MSRDFVGSRRVTQALAGELSADGTSIEARLNSNDLILLRFPKKSPSQGCSNSFDLDRWVQCRRAFSTTLGVMKEAFVNLGLATGRVKAIDSKPTGFETKDGIANPTPTLRPCALHALGFEKHDKIVLHERSRVTTIYRSHGEIA